MPSTNVIEMLIPGLLARRIETARAVATDTATDHVEITFTGPDGVVVLSGPLQPVYRLVFAMDKQLADIARGDA